MGEPRGGGGADLLGFGERCQAPGCGRRDYLPFRCGPCGRTFCLEHRLPGSHGCQAEGAASAGAEATGCIVCPLCGAEVRVRAGEDPNLAFDRHQAAGQCSARGERKAGRPRCAAEGCRAKVGPSTSVECKLCGAVVCLAHRHGEDHQCEQRQAQRRAASSWGWLPRGGSGAGIGKFNFCRFRSFSIGFGRFGRIRSFSIVFGVFSSCFFDARILKNRAPVEARAKF